MNALKNIYSCDPSNKKRYSQKTSDKDIIHFHKKHIKRAQEFQKKECNTNIEKENRRMLDKISDIQKRPRTDSSNIQDKQEEYRN